MFTFSVTVAGSWVISGCGVVLPHDVTPPLPPHTGATALKLSPPLTVGAIAGPCLRCKRTRRATFSAGRWIFPSQWPDSAGAERSWSGVLRSCLGDATMPTADCSVTRTRSFPSRCYRASHCSCRPQGPGEERRSFWCPPDGLISPALRTGGNSHSGNCISGQRQVL